MNEWIDARWHKPEGNGPIIACIKNPDRYGGYYYTVAPAYRSEDNTWETPVPKKKNIEILYWQPFPKRPYGVPEHEVGMNFNQEETV